MSKIAQSVIQDLIARTDLVQLIESRVPLKHEGSSYKACCPFHQEKTPSFFVHPQKQIYHCFGCGVKGNAIGFLMAFERKTFLEAVEMLADMHGVRLDKTQAQPKKDHKNDHVLMQQISLYYQKQLKVSSNAIEYLKHRGLTGIICKQFGVGFAPNGWQHLINHFKDPQTLLKYGLVIKNNQGRFYDRFRNRIMFPIHNDQGKIIGFGGRTITPDEEPKYLNSPQTILFNKSHELYGLYHALQIKKNWPEILVVEGYMDVISLAQFDIHYAVATLGTSTTKFHVQKLQRYTQTIVFSFDGDVPGQKAAWRACEIVIPILNDNGQFRFLFLPEKEDPDSFVRQFGKESFETEIKKAYGFSEFFFHYLKQQYPLNSIEDKAKFAGVAMSHLNKMPKIALREIMMDELSRMTRMDVHALTSVSQIRTRQFSPASQNKKNFELAALKLLIALIVQQPELAKRIEQNIWMEKLHIDGIDLFKKIITAEQFTSTSALLEAWRESPFYEAVLALATWEHGVPKEAVVEEVQQLSQRLEKFYYEKELEKLLNKKSELTLDEKNYIQEVMKKIKK